MAGFSVNRTRNRRKRNRRWKPDIGWEVVCLWKTLPNDTLQSVRLYNNGQQFMIYRPEKHGTERTEVFETLQAGMFIDCAVTKERGQEGLCKMIFEIYQPTVGDFTYTCEVSGERPMFRMIRKDYYVRVLVPPTNATIVSKVKEGSSPPRVMLNCSSTGLPAPRLQWTIDNNMIRADFTGQHWNATSKLWYSWSFLSYIRKNDAVAKCTPEVISNKEIIRGEPAEFNSAVRFGTNLALLSSILPLYNIFYIR